MTYQSSFAAATTAEYEHKLNWGSKGIATGQFNQRLVELLLILKIIYMLPTLQVDQI